jgi:hypothetical protein
MQRGGDAQRGVSSPLTPTPYLLRFQVKATVPDPRALYDYSIHDYTI